MVPAGKSQFGDTDARASEGASIIEPLGQEHKEIPLPVSDSKALPALSSSLTCLPTTSAKPHTYLGCPRGKPVG